MAVLRCDAFAKPFNGVARCNRPDRLSFGMVLDSARRGHGNRLRWTSLAFAALSRARWTSGSSKQPAWPARLPITWYSSPQIRSSSAMRFTSAEIFGFLAMINPSPAPCGEWHWRVSAASGPFGLEPFQHIGIKSDEDNLIAPPDNSPFLFFHFFIGKRRPVGLRIDADRLAGRGLDPPSLVIEMAIAFSDASQNLGAMAAHWRWISSRVIYWR